MSKLILTSIPFRPQAILTSTHILTSPRQPTLNFTTVNNLSVPTKLMRPVED